MLSQELIDRIRERAADPKTRTDGFEALQYAKQPAGLETTRVSMSDFLGGGGSGSGDPLAEMADKVADALFSGGTVNPQEMAQQVVQDMQLGKTSQHGLDSSVIGPGGIEVWEDGILSETPKDLRPPATEGEIAAAEAALGFALPDDLKQLCSSVANGGFGPGDGFGSFAEMAARYRDLRAEPQGEAGQMWPEHLLPIVLSEPGAVCYDLETGGIVSWDEERLADGPGDEIWESSFIAVAESLADWLQQWVSAQPLAEKHEQEMAGLKHAEIRRSLGYWRSMTPEQRAEYGLPEDGWEEALFGHLGVDLKSL